MSTEARHAAAQTTVTITGTGYSGEARLAVSRGVEQLGARYLGDLTYGVTQYLICSPTANLLSDKVSAAHTWGIPVVQHSWLTHSLKQQCMQPFDKQHLLSPAMTSHHASLPCTATASLAKQSSLPNSLSRSFKDSILLFEPEKLRSRAATTNQHEVTDLMLSPSKSPSAGVLSQKLPGADHQ